MLESEDFDYVFAGARLLGRDLSKILPPELKQKVINILNKETGEGEQYKLIQDMLINKFSAVLTFEYVIKLLNEMKLGLVE